MSPQKDKKWAILKKGMRFTVLHGSKNEDKIAFKDMSVEVLQKKMGTTYFRLGNMTCRTIWGLILVIFLGLCPAFGQSIPASLAVRGIVGEAGNQGYIGMLAVACAIRNRSTLHGVYGVKGKQINKEPKWVWDLAKKAWKESERRDITNGATHWENIKAFGKPYWVRKMVKVYSYKDHVFYKKPNKGEIK